MEIFGNIITLIPISFEHLPLVAKWRNNPSVSEMMFDRSVFTLEKQIAWFENLKNDSTREQFIILVKKSSKPIGAINLINIDRKNLHCDWGYYIGEDDSRMGGFAIEAELLILKYAFENLGLNKVYCQTFSFNKKVIAIHSKFGFTTDGILRQHHKTETGFADVVVMSILKEEFSKSAKLISALLSIYDRS
jgi:UDP-4-amino-4,6-dideoxy-N-acetyl-beta-L-altrosamine N-acetyltransferase